MDLIWNAGLGTQLMPTVCRKHNPDVPSFQPCCLQMLKSSKCLLDIFLAVVQFCRLSFMLINDVCLPQLTKGSWDLKQTRAHTFFYSCGVQTDWLLDSVLLSPAGVWQCWINVFFLRLLIIWQGEVNIFDLKIQPWVLSVDAECMLFLPVSDCDNPTLRQTLQIKAGLTIEYRTPAPSSASGKSEICFHYINTKNCRQIVGFAWFQFLTVTPCSCSAAASCRPGQMFAPQPACPTALISCFLCPTL